MRGLFSGGASDGYRPRDRPPGTGPCPGAWARNRRRVAPAEAGRARDGARAGRGTAAMVVTSEELPGRQKWSEASRGSIIDNGRPTNRVGCHGASEDPPRGGVAAARPSRPGAPPRGLTSCPPPRRDEGSVIGEMDEPGRRLTSEVAGLILGEMRAQGVNKTELARRLGRSRPYVTQLLSGQTNMTLRTLVAILAALGRRPRVVIDRWPAESPHLASPPTPPGSPGTYPSRVTRDRSRRRSDSRRQRPRHVDGPGPAAPPDDGAAPDDGEAVARGQQPGNRSYPSSLYTLRGRDCYPTHPNSRTRPD